MEMTWDAYTRIDDAQSTIGWHLRRIKMGVYDERIDGTLEEILEEIWRELNG